MQQVQYLVVGSSHAALEAVNAIRMHDRDSSIALVSRDAHPPYSPTVLPYVVSGKSKPDNVALRKADYFSEQGITCLSGRTLVGLKADNNVAVLNDGAEITYGKLLLATGASPVVPPIKGINGVSFHVLRTLDDAVGLRGAIAASRRAVVLGGGLVGMHAAENLVKAGADVTIVEMQTQLLGAYFDRVASDIITNAFTAKGASVITGQRVVALEKAGATTRVQLEDGRSIDADLLLVATGVRPDLSYLKGSAVAHEDGILVDDRMCTSVANIWAAGDCVQARDFYSSRRIINAILPDAAEQGRIAGMAMAGDEGIKEYGGGVPLNTYHFFGSHAISVGREMEGAEERVRHDADAARYLRVVVKDGRLQGIFGVNVFFDAGIMRQLIMRRVDLSACLDRLLSDPLTLGREFMSRLWR